MYNKTCLLQPEVQTPVIFGQKPEICHPSIESSSEIHPSTPKVYTSGSRIGHAQVLIANFKSYLVTPVNPRSLNCLARVGTITKVTPGTVRKTNRSAAGTPSKRFEDGPLYHHHCAFHVGMSNVPSNTREATQAKDADQWRETADSEHDSLTQGSNQVQEVDHSETFPPTVKMTTVCDLFQSAVDDNCSLHQMGYLNASIDYGVSVGQPESCEQKGDSDENL